MAHTKGHIFGKKVVKELKTWTKPTKGITFTPFKAAYSLAKTAFRHPVLDTASYLLGKKLLKKVKKLLQDLPLGSMIKKVNGCYNDRR